MNMPLNKMPAIPPLVNGDRLTRDEFERRYHAMSHVNKAELIEGVVYMPSPVTWTFHGSPHVDVAAWLGVYCASTPGTDAGDNSTVRLDTDNEPQPDAALIIRPEYGGRVTLDAEGYLSGSPEFILEVSASRVNIDLGQRFQVYLRNQVSEYVVWRIYDSAIDWFVFRNGQFDRHEPDPADGLLKSAVFPGLWLDPAALVNRDKMAVLAALSRGLASPEHAAFVQQLAARRNP